MTQLLACCFWDKSKDSFLNLTKNPSFKQDYT